MKDRIGVGIVGGGFIGRVHARAIEAGSKDLAQVTAVCTSRPDTARAFADDIVAQNAYDDYRGLMEDPDVDAVIVAVPNHLHATVTLSALQAGKHVIVEKPLAMNLDEGRRMVDVARQRGLILAYAEELCFVPKYERARELAMSGGIGQVYLVRQCEKHAGPYSPWFFKEEEAGGGVMMDMGCHSISCVRWVLGKPRVRAVTALMGTYLHGKVTKMEDHCIVLLEFENGAVGQAEASWALKGGMDSTLEIFGTEGVVYADLLKGMGLRAYTERGFQGMWEQNRGWVYPDYEWLWNNGYPQEDRHFFECIRRGETPLESGQDGVEVLEIIQAAYHAAGVGQKVALPFAPVGVCEPVRLWQRSRPRIPTG